MRNKTFFVFVAAAIGLLVGGWRVITSPPEPGIKVARFCVEGAGQEEVILSGNNGRMFALKKNGKGELCSPFTKGLTPWYEGEVTAMVLHTPWPEQWRLRLDVGVTKNDGAVAPLRHYAIRRSVAAGIAIVVIAGNDDTGAVTKVVMTPKKAVAH